MAFIEYGSEVLSFATSGDVEALDARLFEQNEGLSADYVDDALIRSTQRILSQLRATDWWQSYYLQMNTSGNAINNVADIPPLNASRILNRREDFTELCCYYALYDYILPYIANFGDEDTAERKKMGYYQQKYNGLFGELITAGDWYDFDGAGTVTAAEKMPGIYNLRRVR